MFGHDHKDEDKKEGEVELPISTAPPNENLIGVSAQSTATKDDNSDIDATAVDDMAIDDMVQAITSSDDDADEGASKSAGTSTTEDTASPVRDDSTVSGPNHELLEIKRSALQELSPLIDKLDQTPEEKLSTLMMMIQATDDHSHIGAAFQVAKNIKDDKKRAQAMLDIINEINYFTKKK